MALTEESVIDKIEVLEQGFLQVRRADRILRDGEVISTNYCRHTLAPGNDTTGQDARVIAIAQVVWTPEVVAAYEAARPAPVEP